MSDDPLTAAPRRPPNILWFCTDHQRFDTVAALGNPEIRTPYLDALVRQGAAFTHAYCQSPLCCPSRASFMTGRYPSAVHVNYNALDYFPPAAETTLVSRLLAEAGYECGLVGKLHLADGHGDPYATEPRVNDGFGWFDWSLGSHDDWAPGVHGYGDWIRAKGHEPSAVFARRPTTPNRLYAPTPEQDNIPYALHQTTWCSERAIAFIEQAREPWFLCVNVNDPHPTFDPPWEYYRRYDPDSLSDPHFRESDLEKQERLADIEWRARRPVPTRPSEMDAKRVRAAYYAMIELIDAEFGRIVEHLEATGQRRDTVIVFMSDHGEMLGDHGLLEKGCRFYEGMVRVPLLMAWPGRIPAGRRCDSLVELTDVAPTLLEFAGQPIPPLMQGRSLARVIERGDDDSEAHRDFVRTEYYGARGRPAGRSFATMYRDRRWKLVVYHNHGTGELYDLDDDPWEYVDRWNDPDFRDVKADLITRSFDATAMAADPGPPRRQDR
ncbi:MAG: sulfatase-like hydrolase/transferase [Chloroflexota bacterium]|nr:sulfatase-like hydrolase/transferase [Chloroflexota bacterium]